MLQFSRFSSDGFELRAVCIVSDGRTRGSSCVLVYRLTGSLPLIDSMRCYANITLIDR